MTCPVRRSAARTKISDTHVATVGVAFAITCAIFAVRASGHGFDCGPKICRSAFHEGERRELVARSQTPDPVNAIALMSD